MQPPQRDVVAATTSRTTVLLHHRRHTTAAAAAAGGVVITHDANWTLPAQVYYNSVGAATVNKSTQCHDSNQPTHVSLHNSAPPVAAAAAAYLGKLLVSGVV